MFNVDSDELTTGNYRYELTMGAGRLRGLSLSTRRKQVATTFFRSNPIRFQLCALVSSPYQHSEKPISRPQERSNDETTPETAVDREMSSPLSSNPLPLKLGIVIRGSNFPLGSWEGRIAAYTKILRKRMRSTSAILPPAVYVAKARLLR